MSSEAGAKSKRNVFFLGATGFLGSQFLVLLARSDLAPTTHIVALVRNVTPDKEKRLKEVYQDLSIIEGDLDSHDIVKEQASNARYVINCASSDNDACVRNILIGLEERQRRDPAHPPLYIHVSGLAIANDNARGEKVEESTIPVYTDIGFSLGQLPPGGPHLNCDTLISVAGSRKDGPLRTIIAYPGWIYGVSEGYRKTTAALRVFIGACKSLQQMGTWGPGHNSFSSIHVKDAANALLMIFKRAVAGNVDVGTGGHYFLASDEPTVPFREIMGVIGDVLYKQKVFANGGSRPLPASVTDAYGELGWVLLGGNHRVKASRMKRLGWTPSESRKISLLESLPTEVQIALREDKTLLA
ncbi:hypothetical protein D9613_011389 [Agrocybe pediades]|uniref:NAD-dependent epimerase/dehydratase domain-containing protein n=1 Tax=Agrocybe pediades TaxID=84607 RepID=A0A8H4QR97_9AGAR|nr:hypothetical protein D9613_011389 [Agrocybe pediades]